MELHNLEIRTVHRGDLQRCHQIEASCYEPSEAATKENIKKRIRRYAEGFLVARLDGEVVGFINSGATNAIDLADEQFKDLIGHEPEGVNIVILSLAVHKDHQGTGVSRALLDTFIAHMRGLSKERILLICKDNLVVYYKKFGFEYVGRSQSTHGGFQWHEMALEL